jgi:hypothetical protein
MPSLGVGNALFLPFFFLFSSFFLPFFFLFLLFFLFFLLLNSIYIIRNVMRRQWEYLAYCLKSQIKKICLEAEEKEEWGYQAAICRLCANSASVRRNWCKICCHPSGSDLFPIYHPSTPKNWLSGKLRRDRDIFFAPLPFLPSLLWLHPRAFRLHCHRQNGEMKMPKTNRETIFAAASVQAFHLSLAILYILKLIVIKLLTIFMKLTSYWVSIDFFLL